MSGLRGASIIIKAATDTALLLAVVVTLCVAEASAGEELKGVASVKSGNELVIEQRTIRLFGIKAPGVDEICQIEDAKMKCGIVAWAELINLADGWHLSCDIELKGKDSTSFATCYNGERDINEGMVRSGWAKAVRQQTDRYVVDEEDARASKRGLWAGQTPGG